MVELNNITIRGDTATVELKGGLTAIIDAWAVELIRGRRLIAAYSDNIPYVCYVVGKRKVYLHRLVMNAPPDMVVHHKCDTMDNRSGSLELMTMRENSRLKYGHKASHQGEAS